MKRVPFLRPNLVVHSAYQKYLASIDRDRLYSNFGPLSTQFEDRVLSEYFAGAGAVTTVANATLGLMLAISLSRRPGGRYVLMPSFTFAAAPLAAIWCGLEPYFVDIDEGNWCTDQPALAELVERLGDEVAVVLPYATFGTDMDLSWFATLHEAGVPVVVDAAASFGTANEAGQFGSEFPGAVVFSLHATKAFGIGEGGLVYSADQAFVQKLRQASNFGFSDSRESTLQGLNAKLSEYAAAVGLATLDVYGRKIDVRQELYKMYVDCLEGRKLLDDGWSVQEIRGRIPFQSMTVLCPEGQSSIDYVEKLAGAGIDARTYFSPPCHEQWQFAQAARTSMHFTEKTARRVINLPLWEGMTTSDVERIVSGVARR